MNTIAFASSRRFRTWLSRNHQKSPGIWLQFFKKNSGVPTISYEEAVDEAMCFGWIDGQAKPNDALSWFQKFTARRPRSGWSKRNTERAERLIKSGKMAAAGRKEIENAKRDGRWKAAYDSPRNASPPADFLGELSHNKKAKAFFETLNRTNLYAICYRLQTAKRPETREKRMRAIIAMLEQGKKFH